MVEVKESYSSLSQRPEADVPAGLSDRPLKLALAGSAVAFGVAVAGCLIATEGWMPAGHLLYVSALIGLLTGASGLLAGGLSEAGIAAWRQARDARASRPAAPESVPTPALGHGGQLAMD